MKTPNATIPTPHSQRTSSPLRPCRCGDRRSCPPPLRTPNSELRTRKGSALLVTLLVISLLLVMVLTFVTVVRMELRNVVQHQQQLQARAHARLGGELAIARLQELAGPDTRASFPPDAFGAGTPHENNRFWTGIVDTARFRRDDEASLLLNPDYATPLGWLVSGENPDPEAATFHAPFQPLPGHVLLVGPGSVNAPEDAIALPEQAVRGPDQELRGSFAYWVGQENTKAQMNLVDPFHLDGQPETTPWRSHTAQRTAAEVFLPGADPDNALHQTDLMRALTRSQFHLARLDAPSDVRNHFHDFALLAHGLPTQPARGGLKRDLTAVFDETLGNANRLPGGPQFEALLDFHGERMQRMAAEQDALPAANPGLLPAHEWNALNAIGTRADQRGNAHRVQLFPPFSDLTVARDPGGPRWEQLMSWASVHARQSQGQGVLPARQTATVSNPMPVIAKFNLGVYHTMDFPRIRLHLVPSVILWNPYSVPLSARDYFLVAEMAPESTHGGGFSLSFQVSHPNWNSGSRFWTPPYKMEFHVEGEHSFRFRLAATEIPAGGAVIFSLPAHERFEVVRNDGQAGYTFWPHRIDTGVLGHVENKWIQLTPGLHDGGGYSFYVEEPDIRPKIINSASTQDSGYAQGHYNWWDHAGAPLYFSDPDATWTNAVTDANGGLDPAYRAMCFNEGGLDLNNGWEIHRTAAIMIRGMGSPRRAANLVSHTSLGQAHLMLGGNTLETTATSNDITRRPWTYTHSLHNNVPKVLHHATPHFHPGLFPEIVGPPPSFNPSAPFRFNSPGFSPGFPMWGLSWGLRLPDNIYEYAAASGGGDRLNLEAPVAWLAHSNPAAAHQTRSGLGREQGYDRGSFEFDAPANYIGGFTIDPSYFDLAEHTPDDRHAFIGHSDGVSGGLATGEIPRAVLYEIPRSADEVVSVASLAHANPQSHGNPGNGIDLDSRLTRQHWLNNAAAPAYAFGNSLQPPLMHAHRVVRSFFATPHYPGDEETPPASIPYTREHLSGSDGFGGSGNDVFVTFRAFYDHSWILNHLFWDDFFFTPASNSRVVWGNGVAERDLDLSGTRAHIAGAFNVNSTSVDAWRALLYSLLDVEIPNQAGRAEAAPDEERIPFARFLRPHGPAFSPAAGDRYDDTENYSGYRRLSPTEIDALAAEIVREVQSRGPFLSLGDFVNRRLLRPEQDPRGHRLMGALQAAIERSGINDSQQHPADPSSRIVSADFPGTHTNGQPIFRGYDLTAASVARNHSAPGSFTQADLLARIGAVLTTRSDTFTVRAQGRHHSGAVAYCEFIVRRSGDYLDPEDSPETHPENVNPVNRNFGRRFEVISFRWLNPEEV
ncbi:MAG: hypothetical protein LAT83_13050 [Kiritimatiellae bacterium]|nr:hypothetical protein [Kiritimatiellia bacterium]